VDALSALSALSGSRARAAFATIAALAALSGCRGILGITAPDTQSDGGVGADDASCSYSPPFNASADRRDCVSGCISGHSGDLADFFVGNGSIKLCLCAACEDACRAFCTPTCNTPRVPACDDCAAHALVDDGGRCSSHQDLGCDDGGCASLSSCISDCPLE
jgi:hypothetical protein